ncbi:MAG: lysophospholipid acyltransferase family protein [Syntrophomonadaceae bacterium]|nr:lysophospholipid acyltransferase family protein [Syntrophomonadaceae bacterium]
MFYSILRAIAILFFSLLGLKSDGIHNLPERGPVIIASNHVSNWDPLLVASVLNRPIHYIGKVELFKNPLMAALMKKLEVIPVKRGETNRAAIKSALTVLEQNQVLGIFPEGARKKTGDDLKAQAGVAMIAVKSGAPILPVACIGSNRNLPIGWLKPLLIRVGPPINLSAYEGQRINSAMLDQVSVKIMDEINLLLLK